MTAVAVLIVIVCVVLAIAFLLGTRRASGGVELGDKVEVTICMDKEEFDRLLAESDTVPTKAELDALKSSLGIEKGSLQLKSGSLYHITYDADVRKHRWKRLGSYEELTSQVLSNG